MNVTNNFKEQVVFKDYFKQHEQSEHEQKLQHISSFTDEAWELLGEGESIYGDSMPWQKTQDKFRFRPGEVTIWAGVNSNGKSLVMGQCALHLSNFTSVGIASLEMPPHQTVKRMIIQSCGRSPNESYKEKFNKLDIAIYNHVGSLNTETVYGMCHYMAKEKGIKHIMIDSLVKCGIKDLKDNNQIAYFVSKIQDIAKEHKVHIHIVMHLNKLEKETDIPDKSNVKYAGESVDLTDNLLLVYINIRKRNEMHKPEQERDAKIIAKADCYIRVAKQRHHEFDGIFQFYWNENRLQWCEREGDVHNYVK